MHSLTVSELQGVRRVLGRSFAEDAFLRWIFPDDNHRLELTATWLGLFTEGYAHGGHIDTVTNDHGEIVAAALWKIPADAETTMPDLPTPLSLLAALVGESRFHELLGSFMTFVELWPDHPHAYLGLLGVDPDHQRQGLGRRVMLPGIEAASAAGLGVALETNERRNLAFYRSLGFEVAHEYVLKPDGPLGWSLWREPDGVQR